MKTQVHNVKTFDTKDGTVVTVERLIPSHITVSELYREFDADGNTILTETATIALQKDDFKTLVKILRGLL